MRLTSQNAGNVHAGTTEGANGGTYRLRRTGAQAWRGRANRRSPYRRNANDTSSCAATAASAPTRRWEFYGLPLDISKEVLIPRPDTEVLVDQALPYVQSLGNCRVLDLCAGSGCIGLALASQAPQAHVVLGEFSDGALRICRQNTRRNALTGRVIPMTVNALERPDRALGEFHCIVSNPPYIPHGDIPGLDHSVKDYEPHLALDGGEDGLDFYRAISEKWKAALAPGGRLYFEVGIGQADAVLRIMRAQGFGDIQVVKDHNDIPRVVFGTLCGEVYSE